MDTLNSLQQSTRRDFLKTSVLVSGGLMLELHVPAWSAQQATQETELTAWILLHADDRVTIRVARSEMGQGSMTGLPMLVAEELECDWEKVQVTYASPNEHVKRNRPWVTMGTGGSSSIRGSHEYLRKAGATAREMLIAAAAKEWGVPSTECFAEKSVITHKPSGKKTTFGKVAESAAKLEAPKDVKLKDPKEWKLIGQAKQRFDLPDKVLGKPVFGVDVRLPGMVHAAIVQCPVFGGKLKSVDERAAKKRRGVIKVVSLPDAVAVVADNWWRAQLACKALKIEWDEGDNGQVSSTSIKEFLRAGLSDGQAAVARKMGDVEKEFSAANKIIEAEYYAPFLEHATMEPQTCTALIKGDRVEIWTSTQNAEGSLAAAAETAGVPLANVEVHKMQLGGGFGRRGAFQDYVRQAVAIAKALPGKPVKLMWSREEDLQHGYYRPASMAKMKAALDGNGLPVAWHTRIACPSILSKVRPEAVKEGVDVTSVICFSDLPYAIPNQLLHYALRNTHVPIGFWRAVGHSQNPFFRECFLDELAHASGKDPYQLRRELLANSPKNLAVLEACAKAAGWGTAAPKGLFRGIAVQDGYGSFTAAVLEVSVGEQGKFKIHRAVVAVDSGYVVNPDSARAQIESCVVYGLTAALYGECTLKNGRIEQSNFHDYPMLRLAEMPKVESVLVPSGGFWGGFGEPPLMCVAPALCNAIFAATGKRIRSLPLYQRSA